ncbi:hypothetical protein PTKIN_Ptkin19aG0048600 [Pterospermum kingtungense]
MKSYELILLFSQPLDGHVQVSSESTALPYQCSAPANKTNFPCYFYFSGFCNKGDRCSFLHGPDDSGITGKSLKTDALPLDNKTSIENDAGVAPTEKHPNPSKTAPNSSKHRGAQLKEELQQSAPKTMLQKIVSPKTSAFELGEAAFVKSNPLLLKEGITESRSPMCIDEGSEDQVDDHVQPEERWESSPGFDVLVDNKSEELDYENDSEYLPATDGEQREHFLSYDYEDIVQHETPDVEFPYDRDVFAAYEGSDNECFFDSVRNLPVHPRDRMLGSIFFQKRRRFSPGGLSITVDLRNYLRKRGVVEGSPLNRMSRRSGYSHLIGRNLERPQGCNMGRKLRGSLASKVGMHCIESMGDQDCSQNGTNRHGWLKHLRPNCSTRRPYSEKRLRRRKSVSSEVSRNSRERKCSEASNAFTGPKTLAQIREEKRKTEENSGKMRHLSRSGSADFQGPKPLSEILKDKGRLDTVRVGHTSSS